jgi:hypothetical protein
VVDLAALRASPARARVLLAAAETALRGRQPMEEEQARRLAGLARPGLDVAALAADRAEALVQLAAAEATLEAPEAPAVAPAPQAPAEEPVEQPAADARRELGVARQRMVGAVISATGMAIVVAAAGWSPLWHAAPVLLLVLFAADLRMAMRDAKDARPPTEAPIDEAVPTAEDAATAATPATEDAGANRTLALRLAEQARAELARAERGLADVAAWLGLGSLDPAEIPAAAGRVLAEAEYARQSLAWYEARRAVEATGAAARV